MMRLTEAARAVDGRLIGEDVLFTSVSTDSRAVQAGQLFVALPGARVDGHDYALAALEQGAAAVMVAREITGLRAGLLVADTRLALGRLAAAWRDRFSIPLVAVTGSNGKTTVKEMLANILRIAAGAPQAVLATAGNFNNDIGLPLTLLGLRREHRYAVVEMGMNHAGEIRYLTTIGRPTVALINNANMAHVGLLGSVEAIARAKGELFEGLTADGTAIINADDDFAPLWTALAGAHRKLTFGCRQPADVSASYVLRADGSELQLVTPAGRADCRLPLPGRHNVGNALAATAAAIALQIPLAAIVRGLETCRAAHGRLQHRPGHHGALVIDDSYNANPASVRAAIDVLAARPGEKLLVLGDMGELGTDAAALHAEIGRYAREAGVDALYLLGALSREMLPAFGPAAQHFDTPEALAAALDARMHGNSTVLVKGSRFMRMERVVRLIAQGNQEEEHHVA